MDPYILCEVALEILMGMVGHSLLRQLKGTLRIIGMRIIDQRKQARPGSTIDIYQYLSYNTLLDT